MSSLPFFLNPSAIGFCLLLSGSQGYNLCGVGFVDIFSYLFFQLLISHLNELPLCLGWNIG